MTSKERESRPATTRLVERNIAELLARRHAEEQQLGWQDRLAELATRFTGSMAFVWLHLAICAIWVAINLDWIPGLRPFDVFGLPFQDFFLGCGQICALYFRKLKLP